MSGKIIHIIIIVLCSITFISAVTIYAGEPVTITLEKPFDYYSVIGNSTEVILNITQDGNNVTITPNKYSLNDTYEVIFFDKEKEIITVYSGGGGGGGSRTVYKDNVTYVPVDNYVTQYVDKEVEVEVPGETVEVEKIIKKSTWWLWTIVGLLVCVIIYIVIREVRDNE